MAIVVKHGGNVAPTLVGAYGGGQGRRQAEDGRQAMAQVHSSRENAKARRHAASQASAARRHADRRERRHRLWSEQDLSQRRDWQQGDMQQGRDWQQQDLSQRRDWQQEDMQQGRDWQQEDAVFKNEIDRGLIDYRASATQRAEFEHANAQVEAIQNDQSLSEDEREEAVAVIRRRQQGLAAPQPHLTEQSPWPEGKDFGQVWSEGGHFWTRDEKGVPVRRGDDRSQMTHNDVLGYMKEAESILSSEGGSEYVRDPRKIRQLARELMHDAKSLLDPDFKEDDPDDKGLAKALGEDPEASGLGIPTQGRFEPGPLYRRRKRQALGFDPKMLAPIDKEAYEWAKANANDPRAPQIIEQMRGLYHGI